MKSKFNAFKVSSFITDLNKDSAETVKGGMIYPKRTEKQCWVRDTEQTLCTRFGGGCDTAGDCNNKN